MVGFNQFLKQAQSMQKQMQEMQEEMANREYVGKSGGSLVQVSINGRSELQKVQIDKSLINQDEKEMLEDLIVAAFNDAKTKCDADSQQAMNGTFGNLNLPPGFKLPF